MKYKSFIIFGVGFVLGWMISPFFVELLDYIDRHPFIVLSIALIGLGIIAYILYVIKEKKRKSSESNPIVAGAPSASQQSRVQGNQVEQFSPARYFREKYGSWKQDGGEWFNKKDAVNRADMV